MKIIFGIPQSVREAASSVTDASLSTLGNLGIAKVIGDRSKKFLEALENAEVKRKLEQESALHKGLSRNVERSW